MSSIVINIISKFLDVDTICRLIAKMIARLIEKASKKGGDSWDRTKSVISKTGKWCSLFTEVYEDDTLSAEEEHIIADAIKNETNLEKIADILKTVKDNK